MRVSILNLVSTESDIPPLVDVPINDRFFQVYNRLSKASAEKERVQRRYPSHSHAADPPDRGPDRLRCAPVVARCHRTSPASRGSRTSHGRRAPGGGTTEGDDSSAQRTAAETRGRRRAEPTTA